MKVLVITNLFPNAKEPTRGIFNKQQIVELAKLCELKVVAPIPWHHFSDVSEKEMIDTIEVFHPRYFMIPKIGRSLYGLFFFTSLLGNVRKIYENFKFDLIFATWAYPDGFGSFIIAKVLRKPIVIKVHGSDINLYTKYLLRRKMISYTLRNSNKVITVTNTLKEKMVKIGVPEDKITVIPNGVDTNIFKPMNQTECRNTLNLPINARIVLFIGNLVPVKGLDYLIDACSLVSKKYDSAILVIVGDGGLKNYLVKKVKRLWLEEKVKFVDKQPHSKIPFWMNACDVFSLTSLNEGCPNVVLEAFACGKPVVASKVGGLPEIIISQEIGILVEPMNPNMLAQALIKSLERQWDYQKIRDESLKFNWKDGAEKLRKEIDDSIESFVRKKNRLLRRYLKSFLSSFIPNKMILWNAKHHLKRIALTFDDGPNSRFTPAILEILKEKRTRATFFLIGKEVEKNSELTKRIIKEGHSIGIHSYSHNNPITLDNKEMELEIIRSKDVLRKAIGISTDLFRPPRGSVTISQLRYCLKEKITTVLWSVDSMDFENKGVQHILINTIGNGVRGGDIILFHDDNESTVIALPKIIEHFQNSGFELVAVEEMLK